MPKAILARMASVHSFLATFEPRAQLVEHQPERQACGAWVSTDAEQAERAATASESVGAELTIKPIWQSAHEELPAAWPEASDVLAKAVEEARHEPLRFISRRRAEPESPDALARRAMPEPHRAVEMSARRTYHDLQWPPDSPPRPVAARQLYLDGVYSEIVEAIALVKHACKRRKSGERVPKLEPRVFKLHLMAPFARALVEAGGSWDAEDTEDVRPLQPYSARDPVPPRAATAFFSRWAPAIGTLDDDMVEQLLVTGVEARSDCTRARPARSFQFQ